MSHCHLPPTGISSCFVILKPPSSAAGARSERRLVCWRHHMPSAEKAVPAVCGAGEQLVGAGPGVALLPWNKAAEQSKNRRQQLLPQHSWCRLGQSWLVWQRHLLRTNVPTQLWGITRVPDFFAASWRYRMSSSRLHRIVVSTPTTVSLANPAMLRICRPVVRSLSSSTLARYCHALPCICQGMCRYQASNPCRCQHRPTTRVHPVITALSCRGSL